MIRFLRTSLLIALVSAAVLPRVASAGIVTYTSRAAFDAAIPGLPTEMFELGSALPGDLINCASPLNASSNDACFTPGQILAGLELNNNGVDQGGLEFTLVGAGAFLNASNVVFVSFMGDVLNLDFYPGVYGIGFDLYSILDTQDFDVDVIGPNGSLGVFSATPAFDGAFFGVTNDTGSIVRLQVSSPTGDFIGVDNVSFGVPEPASVALAGAGLMVIGFLRRRSASRSRAA